MDLDELARHLSEHCVHTLAGLRADLVGGHLLLPREVAQFLLAYASHLAVALVAHQRGPGVGLGVLLHLFRCRRTSFIQKSRTSSKLCALVTS